MSKYLTAIVALAVSVLALTQGFGQTSTASAAGVSTISISTVSCSAGGVDVTFTWPTLNKGPQYVYWSLQNNGFAAGTYTASAGLPADATSTMVSGLPSSSAIYVMVGTVIGGTLETGTTMVFATTGICDGASYGSMPQYHGGGQGFFPNFMQQACNLFTEGWQGQGQVPFYGPGYGFGNYGYGSGYGDYDDEDEGYWSDEDEDDESDEDEDDEGDESDEDEGDEDEDDENDYDEDDEHDYGYNQYPGVLGYCLPQAGYPAFYHMDGHY